MFRERKCLSRRSSVFLSKCPLRLGALLSPAVPSGYSRELNKPRLRYCNPIQQFSRSSRGLSAGPDGASIQEPDDSVEKTYRRTAGAWRGGKPRCATTPYRTGRDTNCGREKEDVPTSAYSTANKSRQETSRRAASVPLSPESDETPGCVSQ